MTIPRSTPANMDGVQYTERWWTLLKSIAAFNVVAWVATALTVDATTIPVRAHLGLSAIYVAACAFRSIRPRVDLGDAALRVLLLRQRELLEDHRGRSLPAHLDARLERDRHGLLPRRRAS